MAAAPEATVPIYMLTATHGAVPLGPCARWSIREICRTLAVRGSSANKGPAARPIIEQDVEAQVVSLQATDFVAPGASGSLVIAFKDADESTSGSITVTLMKRAGQEWIHTHLAIHEHPISFEHVGAMASTPITVT